MTQWRHMPQSQQHVLSLTSTLKFLVSENTVESVAAGLVTVPRCSGGSCTFPDDGSCVRTAGSNRVWPHCGSSGGCTGSPAPWSGGRTVDRRTGSRQCAPVGVSWVLRAQRNLCRTGGRGRGSGLRCVPACGFLSGLRGGTALHTLYKGRASLRCGYAGAAAGYQGS